MAAGLPRPEPPPAGKLGRKMSQARTLRSRLHLSHLVFVLFLGLGLTASMPLDAFAKTAPVSTVSGDPTVDDAPSSGPKKAAAVFRSPAGVSTRSATPFGRILLQPSIFWLRSWMLFIRL